VADADDCAPMDATIPGPSEIVNNGLDDDCNPATPDGCDDDVFEGPGGNDVDGSATAVDDHNGQGQQYAGLVACPGNEDWYRIDIAAGDGLEADVYFSHDGGDIDVALYKLDAAGAPDLRRRQRRRRRRRDRLRAPRGHRYDLFREGLRFRGPAATRTR
jgi:hypothetical protein